MSTVTPIIQPASTTYPIHQPTPTAIPNNSPRATDGSSFFHDQRNADLQMKKQLEMSIEDTEKTRDRLKHMLSEVINRLGLNKPDGPEDAA